MMRVWPFLMLLLAGCSASEPPATAQLQSNQAEVYQRVSLAPEQAQLVYSGVQRVLSDPASAQFGQIFAGRKPDGTVYEMSDSQRYKQMGNAVTTKVIEAIAHRLP